MVTEAEAIAPGQPPEAATVFVTAYVPGVLAERSINPVDELITSPPEEVNVPAVQFIVRKFDCVYPF